MARSHCAIGVLLLLAAFALNLIASISLPYLTGVDIVRVHFRSGSPGEVRFGVWAHCDYLNTGRLCSKSGHGYSTQLQGSPVTIGSSWTRGLAVHPVATAVNFIALLLGLSTHVAVTLIASLTAFLAATLTLIAFAIDIALYAYVKHKAKDVSTGTDTDTGPGLWMTFAAFILLLLAGCTVCFGRRRDRRSGATYQTTPRRSFFSRFGRRKAVSTY